jgi:hypothetical protein
MRVPWLRGVLECSLELVALLGGVVAVQMPRALLFQQSLKPPEVFFEFSFAGH